MFEDLDSEAKRELSEAYEKAVEAGAVRNDSVEGLSFGQACVKWHDKYLTSKGSKPGNRIRFMWKSLGIPHTAAYHWMAIYRKASGEKPPIIEYTAEELERGRKKVENENRMKPLFDGCGFNFDIKQNCATSEPHFNVIFSALTESQVRELAAVFKTKTI